MRSISLLVALALAGCGSVMPRDLALVPPPAQPAAVASPAARTAAVASPARQTAAVASPAAPPTLVRLVEARDDDRASRTHAREIASLSCGRANRVVTYVAAHDPNLFYYSCKAKRPTSS